MLSKRIASSEFSDEQVSQTAEICAWAHDLCDEKLFTPLEASHNLAGFLLIFEAYCDTQFVIPWVIERLGFSKTLEKQSENSAEATNGVLLNHAKKALICVQDADYLDALGAIGAARTFAYSGAKGQAIYDPNIQVNEILTRASYRGKSTAINHFHEKLLRLPELMQTGCGKTLAIKRAAYLKNFLEHFYQEWDALD